ncbi:hypothetical protein MTO96_009397 [Rhipicephalus appendiculatus]
MQRRAPSAAAAAACHHQAERRFHLASPHAALPGGAHPGRAAMGARDYRGTQRSVITPALLLPACTGRPPEHAAMRGRPTAYSLPA